MANLENLCIILTVFCQAIVIEATFFLSIPVPRNGVLFHTTFFENPARCGFLCQRKGCRFMKTSQHSNGLVLCQLYKVPQTLPAADLGLEKPCVQSSTYTLSYYAGCDNSNDGNRNPVFTGRSCSVTDFQLNPWWQVDLLEVHQISHVTIVRRSDTNAGRFDMMDIIAGNLKSQPESGTICYKDIRLTPPITRTFVCQLPSYGRYVTIQRNVENDMLEMCEVSVFGWKPEPYVIYV